MPKNEEQAKNRFQINCVRDTIIGKESKGGDASFERWLLKSWEKYAGWDDAKQALASCGSASCRH